MTWGGFMLEFVVIVVLCSAWPPNEERCIMPVNHVMQFERKEHCLLFASMLANVVPISMDYPLKSWACRLIGKTTKW